MEFVAAIFGKVLDVIVGPITRQLDYLCNYGTNVQELRGRVRDLQDQRESVRVRILEAERNGENIHDHVSTWLTNTNEKITEFEEFQNDEGHQKTGCSNGAFPNLKLRHNLGRKVKKMIPQCDMLLQQNLDQFSYRPEPEASSVALYDKAYEPFKSRDGIMEEVMKALKDPTVTMIGIYGQGGVGKTTFAKNVGRQAKANMLFNVVVMVEITRTPNLRKIQGEIADMLGLKLDAETELGRAGLLKQRLEKENILIILDDLWAGLDLAKLGIFLKDDDTDQITIENMPNFGQDQFKDHTIAIDSKRCMSSIGQDQLLKDKKMASDSKMCKILLTSRDKEVLSSEMEVKDSIFSVNVMEDEESKKLFDKVVGITDKDSELKSLSIKIVQRCANLPLAIVAAGKALKKNKNIVSWENALLRLEKQKWTEVLKPVEFSTMLSYDHLQDEELKSIFLLCARLGKDLSIMHLVRHCIGLSIFQEANTIREVRDRTNESIKKLKSSSLLLDTDFLDCVTMHDLIWDAALSIASKRENVFTKRYDNLHEWPNKNELEKYTVISLHYCNISDGILEGINCSKLKVFHIDSKDPSVKIPDKLFEGMKELRVLILTGIDLSSIPSSVKGLMELRMLCLEQCVLGGNISIIGELEKLRVLSLLGSKFELLPSELRQLGRLQLFDISSCTRLEVIPPNVISTLNSLEELYMGKTLIQWGVQGKTNPNEIATLVELTHLKQLRSLDVYIQDIATLPSNLYFDQLDGYKILIGDSKLLLLEDFFMPHQYKASRVLALHLKNGNGIHSQWGIKKLFKSIEQLFLGTVDGLDNGINELSVEGFPCLKHLTIRKNSDIQNIIYLRKWEHHVMVFPQLESICLYKLENLEKICNCQLTDTSFRSLKIMKIKTCGRMEHLFSFYMARLLKELETLEISHCDSLQDIVVVQREESIGNDAEISFPQLRYLTLQSLSELTCFYSNDEIETVTDCNTLFNAKVLVANLESLELSSINTRKLWGDQMFSSSSFQNLIILNVNDCGGLIYLFSFSMVANLKKLKSLFVTKCDMMKDIFDPEDVSASQEVDIFPQLKKIKIANMVKLKTIWHSQASINSFCSMESLVIDGCRNLVTIFPPYMVGRFRNLGVLKVSRCHLVEEIFDFQSTYMCDENETYLRVVELISLRKLKYVWNKDPQGLLNFKIMKNVVVSHCSSLQNLFPFSIANDLKELESIEISHCYGMKAIVAGVDALNRGNSTFVFPELTKLQLSDLPKLRCFYQGTHAIEFQALTHLALGLSDRLESIISSLVKVIPSLEKLEIYELKMMKWLQDAIINDPDGMKKIKELTLKGLSSIEILFLFLQKCPNLESLNLCSSVIKEVLPNGGHFSVKMIGLAIPLRNMDLWDSEIPLNILFENVVILQTVEKLRIVHCYYSKNLFPSSVAWTCLSILEVNCCPELRNLLTLSTAKSLDQLTIMKVACCYKMEEIVSLEVNEEAKVEKIVFRKLKSLELVSLRNLTSFCNCKSQIVFDFPSLENVEVRDCKKMEKFSEKIMSAPKLEKVNIVEGEEGENWCWEGDLNATIQKILTEKNVHLYYRPELQQLWRGETSPPDNCFNNLRILTVTECSFMSKVFPSRLLPYFKNLEELEVSFSPVEVIFDIDGNLTETNGKPFGLKRMTLNYLSNLKCIWSKDPHSTTSFINLKEMVVISCGGIKTVFPASLARNLVRLKKLVIGHCVALEEIVNHGTDESATGEIKFERLQYLTLRYLPRLVSFYSGDATLEFSALRMPIIEQCPKLKCFSQGVVRAPNFKGIKHSSDGYVRHKHWDLNTTVQNLFNEKLAQFTCDVKGLKLGRYPVLEEIWRCELTVPDGAFSKLKSLKVDSCQFLSHYVIPSHLLPLLRNLEDLQVQNCNFVKAIFEAGPMSTSFSYSLITMALEELPNLETVWNKDPQEILNFPSLEYVSVKGCNSLKSLFPASIAQGKLESLIKLKVECCEGLVEIVASKEATSEEATRNLIIFPCLSLLKICKLPELRCIYSGLNNVEWPKLKELDVHQCGRLKNIGLEGLDHFSIINEAGEDITLEKVFPNLEHLSLGKEDIMQISQAPSPAKLLQRAKSLKLQCFCDDSDVFPYGFFEKGSLLNVENLAVSDSKFKQIFNSGRSELNGHHAEKLLSQLKTLQLISLSKLNSIGLEHTPLPRNLESLKVTSCPCLINLAPPTVSFSNIRDLDVSDCEGLLYLFTSSTAKSLALLKELSVGRCKSLQEIVTKGDESDGDEITFGNLKNLNLMYLESLGSFSIGAYHLKFPCLEQVQIYGCSQMKVFSHADIHTPDNVNIESFDDDNLKDMLEKAFKKET